MTRSGCALLVLAALVCLSKPAVAQLGVQELVQRSVAANEADWKASAEYEYGETDRDKEGTKTYRVMMIDGSPYNRLIAVNGKPLSEEAAQREQHKLEKTVAKRQSESAGERAERIEKYKKELHRNERFIAEITQGFQFKMLGDDRVDGHAVYVLEATPRPGYHPSTNEAKVL